MAFWKLSPGHCSRSVEALMLIANSYVAESRPLK